MPCADSFEAREQLNVQMNRWEGAGLEEYLKNTIHTTASLLAICFYRIVLARSGVCSNEP